MSTNKIALRTVEEFMADYTPTYNALYPLFINAKAQAYAPEVGRLDFKRIEAVGDIRAKHITPKDTELHQVQTMEGVKSFRKYFLSKQYRQAQIQDQLGAEDVVKQVLDENQKLMDELFLLGEGTAANNVVNNGLYWSNDANYTLKSSTAIAASGRLLDFHSKVMATADDSRQVDGQKVVIFYGADVLGLYDSLHSGSESSVAGAIQAALGAEFSTARMPKAVTPSGANGWIVANIDKVKLHYTVLPSLFAQGHNEENMHFWHNFLMGSCMLEVLAKDGIIRQPATLA